MSFVDNYYVKNILDFYNISNTKNIGFYSLLILLQFTKEPLKNIKLVTDINIKKEETYHRIQIEESIKFINYNYLNEELYNFLIKLYPKIDLNFIFEKPRLNVSKEKNTIQDQSIINALIKENDKYGIYVYETLFS